MRTADKTFWDRLMVLCVWQPHKSDMRTVLLERRPQHSQPRNDTTKMLGLRDKYVTQNINNLCLILSFRKLSRLRIT